MSVLNTEEVCSRAVSTEEDDNVELCLQSLDLFEGEDAEQRKRIIGRNPHLTDHVDNCQGTYEELRDRGVEFSKQPKEMPFGTYAIASYVVDGWMNSDGHRENMLDEQWSHVGIGVHIEDGEFYATAVYC